MNREGYTLFETKLGRCGIAWRAAGEARDGLAVTAFQLPEATERLMAAKFAGRPVAAKAREFPPAIAAIIERVRAHFAGDPQDFGDIVVDLEGAGSFAREVYGAARRIPAGRTMTYGEVARAVKRPKGARAVGQALARNPIPLIIPCHRVLAAGNKPGGFSAPGGVATKAKMLAGEGAAISGSPLAGKS